MTRARISLNSEEPAFVLLASAASAVGPKARLQFPREKRLRTPDFRGGGALCFRVCGPALGSGLGRAEIRVLAFGSFLLRPLFRLPISLVGMPTRQRQGMDSPPYHLLAPSAPLPAILLLGSEV